MKPEKARELDELLAKIDELEAPVREPAGQERDDIDKEFSQPDKISREETLVRKLGQGARKGIFPSPIKGPRQPRRDI